MTSKIMKRLVLVSIAVAGMVLTTTMASSADVQDELNGKALVDALRRGGFNIYFRHAATDWSNSDQVVTEGDWISCDPIRMRQLSEKGRGQSEAIGRAIRRLKIPIGRIYSSEYCRSRDTAISMNLGPVETTRAILNMRAAAFVGGTDALVKRAKQFLSVLPPEGVNNMFVAHGNLMRATSGEYTGEAGAVVLVPRGDGRIAVAAVLDPEDWDSLAREFGLRH